MFQIGPNKSSTVTQSTSITITPTSTTSIGKYSYEYYFEIESTSKEINCAEHEYMNMSPSLIALAPLLVLFFQHKIYNCYFPGLGILYGKTGKTLIFCSQHM